MTHGKILVTFFTAKGGKFFAKNASKNKVALRWNTKGYCNISIKALIILELKLCLLLLQLQYQFPLLC